MSYYVLRNPVGPSNKLADFESYDDFNESWKTGNRFTNQPPDPIELMWDPENEDGVKVSYYSSGVVLMKKELADALEKCGVDNLEKYNTVIRSKLGNPDCHDYVAVNIIGTIEAADMDASFVIDESGGLFDVLFGSLVVDEEKAQGNLFFRLAESVSTVLIHDSVVECLNELGDFGLTFLEPEEYCG